MNNKQNTEMKYDEIWDKTCHWDQILIIEIMYFVSLDNHVAQIPVHKYTLCY